MEKETLQLNDFNKKIKTEDDGIKITANEFSKLNSINDKPWFKDQRIMIPLIITIIISIFISYIISNHFSQKADKTLKEIKNVSTSNLEIGTEALSKIDIIRNIIPQLTREQFDEFRRNPTNPDILNILREQKEKCQEILLTQYKDLSGRTEFYQQCDLIKIKNMDLSTTVNGTFVLFGNFKKSDFGKRKAYILDIGDSDIRDRFSLFIDEYDFLVWRLYQSNFNTLELKYNISRYLNRQDFLIVLTWTEFGNLTMYINEDVVTELKVDNFKLKINSKEMYWGSDMNGLYKLNLI